jgi:hypothetical protein
MPTADIKTTDKRAYTAASAINFTTRPANYSTFRRQCHYFCNTTRKLLDIPPASILNFLKPAGGLAGAGLEFSVLAVAEVGFFVNDQMV